MKLRNRKTGEIGKILKQLSEDNQIEVITDNKLYVVKTLAELNEDWEDYEEPKEYWYITGRGGIDCIVVDDDSDFDKDHKEIGNYFETREQAEKAVEKLKAWKRLKDNGFSFTGYHGGDRVIYFHISSKEANAPTIMWDDLDLLFGGDLSR